jgi:hypothetical protein
VNGELRDDGRCLWEFYGFQPGFYQIYCRFNSTLGYLYVNGKPLSPSKELSQTSFGSFDIATLGIWTDDDPRK